MTRDWDVLRGEVVGRLNIVRNGGLVLVLDVANVLLIVLQELVRRNNLALLRLDEDEGRSGCRSRGRLRRRSRRRRRGEGARGNGEVSPLPVGRISLLKAHPAGVKALPADQTAKKNGAAGQSVSVVSRSWCIALGRRDMVSPESG